jgi:hypothetical protein
MPAAQHPIPWLHIFPHKLPLRLQRHLGNTQPFPSRNAENHKSGNLRKTKKKSIYYNDATYS